mmetsp:Transcript_352/g.694  ORF Transcript_352/g.694 Transcript_352/m.694 type:complete len:202 (+) Transcript_352:671-1276(+)
MPVVKGASCVLHIPPRDGSALRGDEHHLAARSHQAVLDDRAGHPQDPHRADVDHLQLFREVRVIDSLRVRHEVPGVVDDDVDALAAERLHELVAALVVRDVDALDHLVQPLYLWGRSAARGNDLGPLCNQLLRDREAEAAVGSGDENHLPGELLPLVQLIELHEPVGLGVLHGFESPRLVGVGVAALCSAVATTHRFLVCV